MAHKKQSMKDLDSALEDEMDELDLPEEDRAQIMQESEEKGSLAARLLLLSLFSHAYASAQKAKDLDGEELDAWKKDTITSIKSQWTGTVSEPAARLDTVYRTNVFDAFSLGRVKGLKRQGTHGYSMFDAVGDDRMTEICEICDGVVLPNEHEWWNTHTAPMHFNCRSIRVLLTEAEAKQIGITSSPPTVKPMDGFGTPEKQYEPSEANYPDELWNVYERKSS